MFFKQQINQAFRILMLVLIISFSALTAQATTYYVSPTGTTAWPNCTSQSSPCLAGSTTAGKAFLGAKAGDTVYFLSGSYNAGASPNTNDNIPAWVPSNSGTSTSIITFKCLSGTCNITGTGQGPILGSFGADYITWDGFRITVASDGLFAVMFRNGTDHATIKNSEIIGRNTSQGNNASLISSHTTTNLTVRNNILRGMTGTSHNNAGILFYNTNGAIVENNNIYSNTAGIFDKDGGVSNTYRKNYIYSNDQGFLLMTESSGPNPSNILVYQNVFRNNRESINIDGSKSKTYISIYNNTIYPSASYAGAVAQSGSISGYNFYNNIVYSGQALVLVNILSGEEINYNAYQSVSSWRKSSTTYTSLSSWTTVGYDTNSKNAASLVNPGGTAVTDYKLNSYSTGNPCYKAGKNGSTIGAYITGDETIGANSSQLESPPNFRVAAVAN